MIMWLSRKGHVTPTLYQLSRDPNIKSSFASNQTSNIFHPKILHALFSASDLSCHRYKQFVVVIFIPTWIQPFIHQH